jgi:hypothetical protein
MIFENGHHLIIGLVVKAAEPLQIHNLKWTRYLIPNFHKPSDGYLSISQEIHVH